MQPFETLRVPLDKAAQDHFRIAIGTEPVAFRFQLRAESFMVIDFAIEHNGRIAIPVDKRLIATLQIDDLETHSSERHAGRRKDALLIRTTMR